MAIDKENIGLALGRIPSGIFIVTFFNTELNQADGVLMSWIQQCSFEPPMVSVAIKKERKSLELIQKAGGFVVNIFGKQNNSMVGKFYKGQGAEKFVDLKVEQSANVNANILLDGVSFIECKVSSVIETPGDHSFLIGEVVSGKLLNTLENEPSVHLRKNGFDY
jgi:flavin reductase (DIM6/NTAB) family NADH-FMN oxidoreductase RutF